MENTTNQNIGGIDFSQYQSWPSVTTPSGGVYYAVPGTSYVYDPFLSQAKKKPVLFRNPSPRLKAEADAKKLQDDAIDAQKKAASPMGQIAPVLGGVAGIVGSKYAIDALSPATGQEKLASALADKISGNVVQQTVQQPVVNSVATNTASAVPTTAGEAFTSTVVAPNTAISTPVPAGTFESLPTSTPVSGTGSTFGSIIPSNAGALPTAGGAIALGAFLSNLYEGGAKDIIRGKGKSSDFTNLAFDSNPVLAPINMGLRALGMRSLGKQFSTGKNDEQLMRDDFRSAAKNIGIADDKYNVNFSDGSTFNIGKDGSERLKNADGSERRYFDVDLNDPLASYAISKIDPLTRGIYGDKQPKQIEQFTGMLVNSVLNGAKDQATIDRRANELMTKFTNPQVTNQVSNTEAPQIQQTPPPNIRSGTISPGIAKDGSRIDYNRVSQELARRMDRR